MQLCKIEQTIKADKFSNKIKLKKKHSTKQYHMTSKMTAAYQSKILITITKQKN